MALKGIKTTDEINDILAGVDIDKNGAINYTEFIVANLSAELLTEKRLKVAFESLDLDGDGFIDMSELGHALGVGSTYDIVG